MKLEGRVEIEEIRTVKMASKRLAVDKIKRVLKNFKWKK